MSFLTLETVVSLFPRLVRYKTIYTYKNYICIYVCMFMMLRCSFLFLVFSSGFFFFNHQRMLNSKVFSAPMGWSCDCCPLFCLCAILHLLIYMYYVCLHPWNKANLIMEYYLFDMLLSLICMILLRIFVCS
jgi:hypothetical protein